MQKKIKNKKMNMKNALIYLLIMSPFLCFGTNYYFETSGDYSTVANWQGGVAPPATINSTDSVFISSTECILDIETTNNGYFEIELGSSLTAEEKIHNQSNSYFINHGHLTISAGTELDGFGILETYDLLTIYGVLNQHTSMYNYGIIKCSGEHNKPSNSIHNYGTYNLEQTGLLEMVATGGSEHFYNYSGAFFNIDGTVEQSEFHGIVNSVGGVIEVTSSGQIINYFYLENYGSFINNGNVQGPSTSLGLSFIIDSSGIFTNNGIAQISNLSIENGQYINNDSTSITTYLLVKEDGVFINNDVLLGEVEFSTFDNDGMFTNNGFIFAFSGIPVFNGGIFVGNGSIPITIINNGLYSPGNQIGLDTINVLSCGANSTLSIDIGGTQQDSEYDRIQMWSYGVGYYLGPPEMFLSGTIKVNLLNGFIPALDDEFEIISTFYINPSSSSTTNFFLTHDFPALPSNLEWDISYSFQGVILKIVESEPSQVDLNVGINTALPKESLEVKGGKIYINSFGAGIIMRASNGQCFELSVDDAGLITTVHIVCPQD